MADLVTIRPASTHPQLLTSFRDHVFCEQVLNQLDDGVYYVSRDRTILFWNSAAERISGYAASEVVGRSCFDQILAHTSDDGSPMCGGICPLAGTIRDGQPRSQRFFLRHRDGHRLPVEARGKAIYDRNGEIIGAVETFRDVSQELASLELVKSLEAAAYIDPLTGIGNRRFAETKVAEVVAQARRLGWPAGLLFTDIDRFKLFNDTHGHLAGDAVLRMVATTLAQNLRCFDFIGRWGGEEFLILLGGASGENLAMVANRLRSLVGCSSFLHHGQRLGVTLSAGVTAIHPNDTPASVLERADRLLYLAKRERNCVISDDEELPPAA